MASISTLSAESDHGGVANRPPSPPKPTLHHLDALATSTPDHKPTPSPPLPHSPSPADSIAPPSTTASRAARFAALKSRATSAARANLTATRHEAQQKSLDPALAANLSRKAAIASHDLLKLNTEEQEGEGAFERKRAWDYTIEESERWDERMAMKRERRENNAFADYGAEAAKNYDRQVRGLEKGESKPGGKKGERGGMERRREEYDAQKARLVEQAARSGGLEIVEDAATGELVAVDAAGTFFASLDSVHTGGGKPERDKVDALVRELEKAEEVRLRKRRGRGGDDDGGADVTYINQKNKEFNKRLARAYDGYTREVRESFERGTAL